MTDARRELVARGLHALRRSATWWGVGIAAYVVLNTAFWPSLEGSEALEGFEDMGTMLEAFGAQDIASPSGYLDGQVFAFMLPVLLSAMAIAHCTAVTSGDEDAGRLELVHALPVGRRTVWLTRCASAALLLGAVSAAVAVTTVVALSLFSFDGVSAGRVVAATFACALLGGFHAAVGYAAGGLGWPRGRAIGAAVVALVAGYLVAFVLPISETFTDVRRWSPWYWAIGEQPISDGLRPGLLAVLTGVTLLLVWAGTIAVDRRDIRSA